MTAIELVEEICRRASPVLLLDSSSILDLVRAPIRCSEDNFKAANHLLGLASAVPPGCTFVRTSLVAQEVERNRAAVLRDLQRALREHEAFASKVANFAQTLCLGMFEHGSSPLRRELEAALSGLADGAASASLELKEEGEVLARGLARMAKCRAPCRAGRQAADVFIIEAFLELCGRLRTVGFTMPLVFLTSNTGDYCEARSLLHPDLVQDFESVQLRFATNYSWAEHLLGIRQPATPPPT